MRVGLFIREFAQLYKVGHPVSMCWYVFPENYTVGHPVSMCGYVCPEKISLQRGICQYDKISVKSHICKVVRTALLFFYN